MDSGGAAGPIELRTLDPDDTFIVSFPKSGNTWVRFLIASMQHPQVEICRFDPGFGDDLVVAIDDPLAFARWHMGRIEWAAAVRNGAITVTGPRALGQALPTWNAGPEENGRMRAEHGLPVGDLS